LAIAAAKLTTESTEVTEKEYKSDSVVKILACDTDKKSVEIARENAIANGAGEKIEFRDGSINNETPVHDFVCANLTIDVIIPILPQLIEKTRFVLLLSGILATQQESIVDKLYERKVTNLRINHSGEWISVIADLR
jgi:ribosomal protein L11 methylase PrmA